MKLEEVKVVKIVFGAAEQLADARTRGRKDPDEDLEGDTLPLDRRGQRGLLSVCVRRCAPAADSCTLARGNLPLAAVQLVYP